MWAAATVSSARSTRMLGAPVVVAWVLVVGLVLTTPVIVAGGTPGHLRHAVPALVISGLCAVAGFLLTYTALSESKVSLVAPVVSAEGAVAAVVAVIAGESLSRASAFALLLIACGVALASANQERTDGGPHPMRGFVLAICAALAFGIALYTQGLAGEDVPALWVTFSSRVLGTAVVLLPLAARGNLRLTRAALPYVVLSGICEVVGSTIYVVGARHSVAVTAGTPPPFAALPPVAGFWLFWGGPRGPPIGGGGGTPLRAGGAPAR